MSDPAKDCSETMLVAADLAEQEGHNDLASMLRLGTLMLPPMPNSTALLGMFKCAHCDFRMLGWFGYKGNRPFPVTPPGWTAFLNRFGGDIYGHHFWCPAEKCQQDYKRSHGK